MPIVQLADGTKINFAKTPTPAEVDFAYAKVQSQRSQQQNAASLNAPSDQNDSRSGIQKAVEKVADFTGGKKIGQGIASAVMSGRNQRNLDEIQKSQDAQLAQTLAAIREKKAKGEDTTKLESALQFIQDDINSTGQNAEALVNPFNLSGKQVLGDALQTASTVAGFGTYGAAAKGAGAAKAIPSAIQNAAPKAGSFLKSAAGSAARVGAEGAVFGAATGAAEALKDDGELADVIRGTITGGALGGALGTAFGGAIGVIGAGSSKLRQLRNPDEVYPLLENKNRQIFNPTPSQMRDWADQKVNPIKTFTQEFGIDEIPVEQNKMKLDDFITETEVRYRAGSDAFNAILRGSPNTVSLSKMEAQALRNIERSNLTPAQQERVVKAITEEFAAIRRVAADAKAVNMADEVPVAYADNLKDKFWGQTNNFGFDSAVPSNEQNRAIGRAFREGIEGAMKGDLEVMQYNKSLQELINLKQFLESKNGRVPGTGGMARRLVARVVGATAGSAGGVAGSIGGAITADALVNALINPNAKTWILRRALAKLPSAERQSLEAEARKIIEAMAERRRNQFALPARSVVPEPAGGTISVTPQGTATRDAQAAADAAAVESGAAKTTAGDAAARVAAAGDVNLANASALEPYTPDAELPVIKMGAKGKSKYKKADPNLPKAEGTPNVPVTPELQRALDNYAADPTPENLDAVTSQLKKKGSSEQSSQSSFKKVEERMGKFNSYDEFVKEEGVPMFKMGNAMGKNSKRFGYDYTVITDNPKAIKYKDKGTPYADRVFLNIDESDVLEVSDVNPSNLDDLTWAAKLEQYTKEKPVVRVKLPNGKTEYYIAEDFKGSYVGEGAAKIMFDNTLTARKPKANLIGKNAKTFREDAAQLGPDAQKKNVLSADFKLTDAAKELTELDVNEWDIRQKIINKYGVDVKEAAEEYGDPDAVAYMRRLKSGHSLSLREAIDYPELFNAYPEAKNIKINFIPFEYGAGGVKGEFMFRGTRPTINIYPLAKGDYIETIKHELQHFIQAKEGWQRGGSTMSLFIDPDVQYFVLKSMRDNLFDKKNRDILDEASVADLEYIDSLVERARSGKTVEYDDIKKMVGTGDELQNASFSVYRSLYGEAEARANGIPEPGKKYIKRLRK